MRIRIATLAVCWVVLSAAALGQPMRGTGSISGTVRDISGALIPDAAIELENPSRGIRRSAKTDSSGTFEIIALDPASGYIVTVT
ncbi:MAG: carboxypeptidase-like regulatory domain-containing protein, partial [Candidatus Solibacter sp.]|nr:carboxypeptidase-like regulatory domain-containing protein [Candidatus Solibacter sp.]